MSAFYSPADPGCGVVVVSVPSRAGGFHASQKPAPSCARRPSSISGARRNSRMRPVYTHSSSRTGTSTGYEGAAGAYMDLDEVSFLARLSPSSLRGLGLVVRTLFHSLDSLLSYTSHRLLFLALPSLFSRARPRTFLLDHNPPAFVFASPFVILALVVHPSSSPCSSAHAYRTFPPSLTAYPWRLRLDPAPFHLRTTRTALPSAYPPSPPCSFPLFFVPLLFGSFYQHVQR
jgi:hypothetical protein